MVFIKNDPGVLNNLYTYEDPHLSFNSTTRKTYKLDPDYWKTRVKKYREDNLAIVKQRQKDWYNRRPDVIKRRRMRALGMTTHRDYYYGEYKINKRLQAKRYYNIVKQQRENKKLVIGQLQVLFNIIPLDKKISKIVIKNVAKQSHMKKEEVIKELKERFNIKTTPFKPNYIRIEKKQTTISFD
jgi:hypothetical protein